jgi:D-alanyl-lipoteichoic acid acyltransferase DltB (MBOAT superfamily)
MSFNSTTFIFFLVCVVFAYWALARRDAARIWFLLLASCAFYMSWNALFILLVLFSAVVDYGVGLALGRTQKPAARRALLLLTLVSNLGLLGFFKYANFFAENVHALAAHTGLAGAQFVPWHIILPVGISFYTFQTLSYTIDVYRGQLEPCRSFSKFLLFVTFFPQLVAGPIVRAVDFLPQLDRPAVHDDRRAASGLFMILCGLFKKVVLADMLGQLIVDPVYAEPGRFGAAGVVIGVWGALFQFYLDFSAYSDIAIGCAALLGFRLPLNFDRPFLAQTISEFWRRWRISLSTWFRDYVFLGMGGRGKNNGEFFWHLMLTMLLTGLWHGAGWNYVLWGGMHGVFTFCGNIFRKQRTREQLAERSLWERLWRRALTFNLVALSMLFFRNGTVAEGNNGISGSLDMLRVLGQLTPAQASLSGLGLGTLAVAALLHYAPRAWLDGLERRWIALPSFAQALVLVLCTGILGAVSYQQKPFIYFQF